MIKIIEKNFDHQVFNKKAYHPLQLWEWGEARKKMGLDVLRIAEFQKDQLINVYTITVHPIPFTSFKIGYLPRSVFPTKEVLDFLYQYGQEKNLIFIKIEPYLEKRFLKESIIKQFNNLTISPHPLFPKWTQILDLTKSEDELLRNMHYKTRYNIRLAQKKRVRVKEMSNDESFKIFSRLYFETCKRQHYFGHNLRYHQIVWQNLKEKISRILIAFYKNEPLAAYQIWIYNDIAYYVYGGSSEKYRNLMGANLLMWEAIKMAKNKGAKKFDMWGSLPPNYSH
ncbi:MAG: lipid II:glycine glycyltransferase FemX, partial [Microgenomates group bacterium]